MPAMLLSMLLFVLCAQARAQTVTSSTVITPVCASSNGTLQLNFSGTFPFNVTWYGAGVQSGTATITSSTQNLTLIPDPASYFGRGFGLYLYGPNQVYMGYFEAGMNYDIPSNLIAPTCTTPASFAVNNMRNGTGPFTVFLEDRAGTVLVSGSSPLSIPFNTLCPANGSVQVRIADANGCSSIALDSGVTVRCNGLNVALSSTMAACTTGTATVTSVTGSTGTLAYLWSNGATTTSISGLRTGVYSCTVTDASNCSGRSSVFVDQTVTIYGNTNVKAATCNNLDGQATAFGMGGTLPYTYAWDNGATGQTVTNLQQGPHRLRIEDANLCTGNIYFYVNSVSPVNVTFTATASACTSPTGTATLTVSGGQAPYTYVWFGQSSTSNSISGLPPGEHGFRVTDANGCTFAGRVVVPPVSVINASVTEVKPVCPNSNGSLVISAGSTAGAVTYLWNTGATTSSLSNLGPGTYTCTIRDGNGCALVKTSWLNQVSTLSLNLSTVNASCIFTADGSATAFATGGTAPYTYSWSDGSNTQTISNKTQGIYFVSATDANGCRSNAFRKALIGYNPGNNSCYCEIRGRVFDDLDSNCAIGSGENGIYNAPVHINSIGAAYSDYNGNYSIKVPAGAYTVTQYPLYSSKLSPCQSNPQTITFSTTGSGCAQVFNFGNIIVPYHDIITFPLQIGAPIPGRNYTQKVVLFNNGNRAENNIDATLYNDGKLSLSSSSPTLSSLGGNLYKPASPVQLLRGDKTTFSLNYFTPTNLPLGAQVYFRDSCAYQAPISSNWITNEASPWNNITEYFNVVRASYDPNQKTVFPQGEGPNGNIGLDQKDFLYVVQFENNGTANADKVVIIDSLESDFDIASFRTLDASHKVSAFVSDGGVVTFTFDRINLAYTPKGVNNPLAQGYVAFTIKAKPTVKLNDKLENFADIYFDYNDPIRTNTTLNTYASNPSSVKDVSTQNGFSLYPNPTQGVMQITIPAAYGSQAQLAIYNLNGQLLQTLPAYRSGAAINTSALAPGIYFVKLNTESGHTAYLKFTVQ